MNIDELTITNISHYKMLTYNGFLLYFTIDGIRYKLHANVLEDGKVHPTDIDHFDSSSAACTYCKETTIHSHCPELFEERFELFHRLIEHPSIRLEWLYIDHV